MSEQTCHQHLQRLNAEMMGSMTMPTAELEGAYAELLNVAYAMYYDLAEAERRIWELEQKEQGDEKVKCPRCEGEGKYVDYEDTVQARYFRRCHRCGGKGYLEGEELGHKSPE